MKRTLACCVVLTMLVGCRSGNQCQELLGAKCIQCHSHVTSCAKVGESERRWLGIIDAMVKLGADISVKERKILAECLSDPSGSFEGVCR